MTDTWSPTACILCECNCGIEVQLEDRTLARIRGDKAHPGTQGYTCNKAHAPRPLPERSRPPDRTAAPPGRRDLRGDRLGHRHRGGRGGLRRRPRAPRRRGDHVLRRRAARATTSAAPTAARSCARSVRVTARARSPRRRPGRRGSTRSSAAATPAASSTMPRSRSSSARTRGMSQSFPRARDRAARDRQGPGALDDRHRPGA